MITFRQENISTAFVHAENLTSTWNVFEKKSSEKEGAWYFFGLQNRGGQTYFGWYSLYNDVPVLGKCWQRNAFHKNPTKVRPNIGKGTLFIHTLPIWGIHWQRNTFHNNATNFWPILVKEHFSYQPYQTWAQCLANAGKGALILPILGQCWHGRFTESLLALVVQHWSNGQKKHWVKAGTQYWPKWMADVGPIFSQHQLAIWVAGHICPFHL